VGSDRVDRPVRLGPGGRVLLRRCERTEDRGGWQYVDRGRVGRIAWRPRGFDDRPGPDEDGDAYEGVPCRPSQISCPRDWSRAQARAGSPVETGRVPAGPERLEPRPGSCFPGHDRRGCQALEPRWGLSHREVEGATLGKGCQVPAHVRRVLRRRATGKRRVRLATSPMAPPGGAGWDARKGLLDEDVGGGSRVARLKRTPGNQPRSRTRQMRARGRVRATWPASHRVDTTGRAILAMRGGSWGIWVRASPSPVGRADRPNSIGLRGGGAVATKASGPLGGVRRPRGR